MKQMLKMIITGTLTAAIACAFFSCESPTTNKPKLTYAVTYNANGATSGTVPIDEASYKEDDTVTVLGNTGTLSLTGSLFAGWNTKPDGTGTQYPADATFSMPSSPVTLYARWTAIKFYTLTFSANGATEGTIPEAKPYAEGSTVTLSTNTGNLVKTAYSFAGWNTKPDGAGTAYTAGQSYTMPAEAVTLYAHWTADPLYTLTLSSNGAESGTVPVTASYLGGATITLPANTGNLIKAGYGFAGWNTLANGTGIFYAVGTSFTMPMGAATLYAHWSANHTITFNANGGTGSMTAQTIAEKAKANLTANTFSSGNSSFAGWATTAGATAAEYANGAQFTMGGSDITLYAVWSTWYSYTLTGTNATITGFSSNWDGSTAIVIPSAIAGNTVVAIAASAFRDKITLTSVVIPDTVTSLGGSAFYGCTNLTSIDLGNSITKINDYTFQKCEKLASIVIPGSVTAIGNQAFAWCYALASVTIENGPTSIGNTAFYESPLLTTLALPASIATLHSDFIGYCPGLTSFSVDAANTVFSSDGGILYNKAKTKLIRCPEAKTGTATVLTGTTEIAYIAFASCVSLTGVNLPSSLTTIGDYAFYNCLRLTSITLPASVTSIGVFALKSCISLTSITIPVSVTTIKEGVFNACSLLTTFTVTAGNTAFSAESGILFNTAKTAIVAYPGGKTGTSYTIPSTVTAIEFYAFYNSKLTSITIPSSVTNIKAFAFELSKLTSVTIPSTVTSIGNYAFSSCSSLTAITIQATTPPTSGYSVFQSTTANISVPSASVAAYKAATNWSTYASRIVGY